MCEKTVELVGSCERTVSAVSRLKISVVAISITRFAGDTRVTRGRHRTFGSQAKRSKSAIACRNALVPSLATSCGTTAGTSAHDIGA